jgi:hypothetical protein
MGYENTVTQNPDMWLLYPVMPFKLWAAIPTVYKEVSQSDVSS